MLLHILSDAAKNPSLLMELRKDPEQVLSRYPEVTHSEARDLLEGDIQRLTASVSRSVVSALAAGPGGQPMYPPVTSLGFVSLSPNSGAAGQEQTLTMLVSVTPPQPAGPDASEVQVQFEKPGSSVQADVTDASLSGDGSEMKLTMTVTFPSAGAWSSVVVGLAPFETPQLVTQNAFTAT